MVVIFTISTDGSTSEVIDWIRVKNSETILRINTDKDDINFIKFNSYNKEFLVSKANKQYNLFNVKSFWYRKGGVIFRGKTQSEFGKYGSLNYSLTSKLKLENAALNNFMKKFLEYYSPIKLGSAFNSTLNKLNVLEIVKGQKIKTPETFILSNKSSLEELIEKQGDLITKAISDGIYVYKKDYSYYSFTELINKKTLKDIEESFFPSLFQKKVKKKYEIRTFFLDDTFYSMAIFSQSNKKTEIDFRKYDGKKPNRFVPYKLPKIIEDRLKKVFNHLNLNTGSVDLLKDINGDYIFLEINPVGQFSMVSYPCNYHLEKKVAEYLTQNIS